MQKLRIVTIRVPGKIARTLATWALLLVVTKSAAPCAFAQNGGDAASEATANRGANVLYGPLPPSERLAISFSKSTDRFGKSRQVVVFFGRVDGRGWEAIGNGNVGELQAHWRKAAERSFSQISALDLSAEERQKLELGIEFTIAQFIRTYQGLQSDLDSQLFDQQALASDQRFKNLRELGASGLFNANSFAVRVARRIVTTPP